MFSHGSAGFLQGSADEKGRSVGKKGDARTQDGTPKGGSRAQDRSSEGGGRGSSVVVDGVDVSHLNDNELSAFRNSRIGFVFQSHNLLPEFTAFENICIPGYIGGRDRREVEARAAELIDILGLTERAGHKPAELSGGEAQRVAIARALVNSPAVLLADEPSGNLDSRNRDEIHRLFLSLRERFGQTIIIVTHDESLAAMADRKIVMADGVII